MPHQVRQDPALQTCIELCLDCYRICQQTALTHCLRLGGRHAAPEHVRLMLDCAELCRGAAALMLSDSPFLPPVCATCADACLRCAESCERIGDMEACVRACRDCAEGCERMSAGIVAIHKGTAGAATRLSSH